MANAVSESSQAASAGKDVAWIAYILHAVGYLSVTMLPALIGLLVNYLKRGEARGGYVDSHHAWMIRTFWYGSLWYVLSLGVLASSVWPWLRLALSGAASQGTLTIDWGTIFSSVGAAALGGIGFLVTWIWLVYRLIRGIYCLAESRPVP